MMNTIARSLILTDCEKNIGRSTNKTWCLVYFHIIYHKDLQLKLLEVPSRFCDTCL